MLPSALPMGQVDGRALILLLGDPDGRLVAAPAHATLASGDQAASCVLLDDGQGPDAETNDGVHSCAIPDYPRGEVKVELTDDKGTSLWLDVVPVEGLMSTPRIAALLTGTHVRIALETVGEMDNGVEEPPPEEPVDPMAGEPQPGEEPPPHGEAPSTKVSTSFRPSGGGGGGWLGLLLALGLGYLAGFATAPLLRRLRRRRGGLSCAGGPAPLSGSATHERVLGKRQLWVVPHAEAARDATVAIARALAGSRPVLLAVDPRHREELGQALAGAQGVYELVGELPEAVALLKAAKRLGEGTTLLVQGHGALEQALEGEGSDAVVEELLEEAPRTLDLLILAESSACEELEPVLRLEATPSGLVDPEGQPLFVKRDEGAGLSLPSSPSSELERPSPPELVPLPELWRRVVPPLVGLMRPVSDRPRWLGALPQAPALPGLPTIEASKQAWLLPDQAAVHELGALLAPPLAQRGPLLIAPSSDARAPLQQALQGLPLAHWLPTDQPDPRKLLRAAKRLIRAGKGLGIEAPPVLLVLGQPSLEPALDDEPVDAVLAEILADAPDELSVLVLCTPDTLDSLEPSATLTRDDQGQLCADSGPLRLS